MSDEDDDWEDVAEELYAIEIQGYSNSADETVPINKAEKVKVIGMETPNPIMQIDGFIFKGLLETLSNFHERLTSKAPTAVHRARRHFSMATTNPPSVDSSMP